MAKYIDADVFERVLLGLGEDVICDDCCLEVLDRLDKAPAADVEPVRHGRWVSKEGVYGVVYCSICDYELKIDNTPYCPYCGAKMDKEEDHENQT